VDRVIESNFDPQTWVHTRNSGVIARERARMSDRGLCRIIGELARCSFCAQRSDVPGRVTIERRPAGKEVMARATRSERPERTIRNR
jgi:hypothetical protein